MNNELVLVTGADGFIGSHLVEFLVKRGFRVRAMAYYNSFGSWGWLDTLDSDVKDSIEVILGDVRDRGSVAVALNSVDVVYHLAALIGIPYSYHSPESYVAANISGTLNILEESRRQGVKRLLVTSTSETYGSARYVPIDEKHPLQGQSPYSATKIGADKLAESYWLSFGTPVTIVRPFNTYGPRQSLRAFIPTVISQILAGQTELKMGSLDPRRDLVFCHDTAEGFFRIAKAEGVNGEVINISTGYDYTVGEVVEMIQKIMNVSLPISADCQRIRPDNSEVLRLMGCNKKLQTTCNWKPDTALEVGLQKTVEWFRHNSGLYMAKALNYNI
jgi:NAD dependent epimerase/dehydratase